MVCFPCLILLSFPLLALSQPQECPPDENRVPYIFHGNMLPNHGYVSANGGIEVLECHASSSPLGSLQDINGYVGHWQLPNGSIITPGDGNYSGYSVETQGFQIDLEFNVAPPEIGIYRCEVPTPNNSSETAHVGIFYDEQGIFLAACKKV